MPLTQSPTCYVIGTESLLIQCCEVLLENGFEILGVVSTQAPILHWASQRKLRSLQLDSTLTAALSDQPPDYIFSIANLSILSREVLKAARKGTINFHDGPLPRFAGLHTTSWALLERQSTHGVTWHHVEGGIDEGDILRQEVFPLEPGETALTLNARCYEAGLRSFSSLVPMLRAGSTVRQRQDFLHRRYYALAKRPEAACAIAWDRSAEEVSALVRALDFGSYVNPLGLAKACLGGRWFAVGECELTTSLTTTSCGTPPGTILAVDGASMTVAAQDRGVTLRRLSALDGSPIDPSFLGAVKNGRLDVVDSLSRTALSELHADVASHEAFWVSRLQSLSPVELPYLVPSSLDVATGRAPARQVELPSAQVSTLQAATAARSAGEAVAAALCTLVARLGGQRQFDVGWTDPPQRQRVGALGNLFAAVVPLRVDLREAMTARGALTSVASSLDEVRRRKTYAIDTVARYPQLRNQVSGRIHPAWPLRIEIVESLSGEFKPARTGTAASWTVHVEESSGRMRWEFDAAALQEVAADELERRLRVFVASIETRPDAPLSQVSILDPAEIHQVTNLWSDTQVEYRRDSTIHQLFQEQAARTPAAVAVVFENESITYQELDARSNRIARRLRALGVGPDVLVGIYMERSLELVSSLLGILKSGGAYLPLDPGYPAERLELMLTDAKAPVLLTQARLVQKLPTFSGRVVTVDAEAMQEEPASPLESVSVAQNLAYVIYTSGSTGKPKGVMVEHQNVINFFVGMDERLQRERAGVWLAVTSLSFDISVLEIFWTLTRGFKVVLHGERSRALVSGAPKAASQRALQFSLYYFASDERQAEGNKYRLLFEGAKFADTHGFTAVWSPERHFHAFGGLYPNPSVASAALAVMTERVQLRAGSVVSPLHHPARIAEEWALVDNFSNGRVGISFASGWHPDDFVFRPENHADARNVMLRDIDAVRRLWRGEKLPFPGPRGDVLVGTLPRPVQKELPVWITAAGNPETFRTAGEVGANLLTHLLGQSLEELDAKLKIYRQAWKASGHAGAGHVTLMLHTFVGDDEARVRDLVREPMINYLRSAAGLIRAQASSFPAFKKRLEAGSSADQAFRDLSPDDLEGLLQHAFERYYVSSGLFGTVETCGRRVEEIKGIGVDEVACLIDFGVPAEATLAGLTRLNELRVQHATPSAGEDHSIAAQIVRHEVTHLQCTPSLAAMLLADPDTRDALGTVRHLMVGGEALPPSLAQELLRAIPGTVTNLYGPTETTVWSSTQQLNETPGQISIGTPIANTQFYILDRHLELVPAGMPGELFIGGDGVARGYLHRPELTAEKFVMTRHQQGRLYRTGDLVRHLPDGKVEFLGRLDHQVKIRGHRIELGEIEERLREHAAIKDAVVVAREDVPGDRRLVAYYVPTANAVPGGSVVSTDLRRHLQERLPEIMVPAHLVELSALPLTPNGKVDRKALPVPEATARVSEKALVPLDNGVETQIAAIWQQVLGVARIGADDNFFDLGGHSLLVVELLAKLRAVTGRNLPITEVFRFPTVRTLARYLENGDQLTGAGLDTSQERGSTRREVLLRRRGRQR